MGRVKVIFIIFLTLKWMLFIRFPVFLITHWLILLLVINLLPHRILLLSPPSGLLVVVHIVVREVIHSEEEAFLSRVRFWIGRESGSYLKSWHLAARLTYLSIATQTVKQLLVKSDLLLRQAEFDEWSVRDLNSFFVIEVFSHCHINDVSDLMILLQVVEGICIWNKPGYS